MTETAFSPDGGTRPSRNAGRLKRVSGFSTSPARLGGAPGRVATLSGGTFINQLLLVASLPILARFYSPADYGAWFTLKTTAILFGSVGTLRLELAIVLAKSKRYAERIADLALTTALALAVVSSAIIALFGGFIIDQLGVDASRLWLWALPPIAVGLGVVEIGTQSLLRENRVKPIPVALVMQTVITVGLQCFLGATFGSNMGFLAAGAVAGQVASATLLWRLGVGRWPRLPLTGRNRTVALGLLQRHRDFPLYVTPYSFVHMARAQLTLVIIGAFGGFEAVGFYAMAHRMVSAPTALVAGSMRQVFFPVAAGVGELRALGPRMTDAFRLLALGIFPAAAVAFVLRDWVIDLVLGEDWSEVASFILPLGAVAIATLFTGWLDRLYHVMGRQRLALLLELGYATVALAAITIAGLAGVSALGIAWVLAITTVAYNLVWLTVTLTKAGIPIRPVTSAAAPGLVIGVAFGIALALIF